MDLKKIADTVRNNIETYAQNTYDDGHRTHLGASLMGDKCKRKLWFTFRHVYHHKHTGRMQRLFNTGHKEEARIIEWLQDAGYEVNNCEPPMLIYHPESESYFVEYDFNFDKDYDAGLCDEVKPDHPSYREEYDKAIIDFNFRQFRISDCSDHFGGSIDGIITIPELGNCLLECKTNKTGSEFKNYFELGMAVNKPKHWAQICAYGKKLGLRYCVYVCKNKDNDDLYIEIVELDWKHGEEMVEKAKEIIFSREMPARMSETPAYFECKFCDYVDVCFKNKEIEKNCRSCKHCSPVAAAEWNCSQYGIVPKEHIGSEKPCWESIL